MYKPCAKYAALVLLAAPLAVCAQRPPKNEQAQVQQLKSLSLADLGNIQVTTVNKEPEDVWQTPAAVYVLTENDIRRSGATTLPNLLRTVPGVEVAQVQNNYWAVGIRGFGSQFSRGVLLLIDGRSAYTELFEGVYWDVQDVPLDDIERIEIVRGPGGTIWGANAVNGVINIITKDAHDTQGALATGLSGHVNRFNGTLREGLHHRDFYYRVYAHAFLREPAIDPGFAGYDRWHLVHGGFRADWNASQRDTLTLKGNIYTGQSGQQVGLGVYQPLAQIAVNGTQDISGGDLNLHWDHHYQGGSDLRVQAYFDRTNRHGPQFGETRSKFDVDVVDRVFLPGRNEVIWGAGIRLEPSHFIQTQATVDFLPHNQTDYIYSAFAQDTLQVIPSRLNLVAGTKLEYNNFSGFEYQPSVRLLLNPTRHSTLWGAVSRAVRTPGRLDQDLQLTGVISSHPPLIDRVEGDPLFQSEILIGYEAGYRQLLTRNLFADVAAFHNRYEKLEGYGIPFYSLITTPITATVLNVPIANSVDGNTDGIEIAPDWKVTPWWDLKGNYSYLHIKTQPRPAFAGTVAQVNASSYNGTSPHRETTAQSYFDLPHGFNFNLDYRFVSRIPFQGVGSYQTGDAHAEWKMDGNWRLFVTGRNLLQPQHQEFNGENGNRVGIRREVFAGLTWTSSGR
ncbi:MAG TPA: TonB-dependent receptor plug domain-containing protein [Terracidiphilus sp.]|nr:TonB-dependent receptor plug domain-containing protein [Terracidiphilus sp.]